MTIEVEPSEAQDAAQELRKLEAMALLERHSYRPPWWLRSAHAQTVGARYGRRVPNPAMRAERWDTPDDDFLTLHFLDGAEDAPTALVLHGLEGSVESTYVLGLLRELAMANWNAVALEFRSCGAEMNRARRMYHSGETSDLAFVVDRLIERRPNIALYIAGYSLGGNVTAKWFGEMGTRLPKNVKAAAVVSAPYDLLRSGIHMDNSISLLYVRHFLRKLIPKAVEKERQVPGCMDIEKVKRARTFKAFDDFATAPLHGFEDARDYYTKSGCGQFLDGIRRPTLLISSDDDPFNPGATLPRETAKGSPWLHPLWTVRGGHVGFIREGKGRGVGNWAEEQIVRFFEAYNGER